MSVYRWVRELAEMADSGGKRMKVAAGDVWVADEAAVSVGGENSRLFDVMDSDFRFVLAAYRSRYGQHRPRRWRW